MKLPASLLLTIAFFCGPVYSGQVNNNFQLKILHINDHHSHLEADNRAVLTLEGTKTRVGMGGFPRVVSQLRHLSADKENVLKLHAGDAITGTLYYTLFKGEADAELMNLACFDAFTLGNHEFDEGDANLANFLRFLKNGECNTAVISANVLPEKGTPLYPATGKRMFSPYTVRIIKGEKVGIIGIDIADKTRNSSRPYPSTYFMDELETVNLYTRELRQLGVNKIILLTHFQYDNDISLAKQVKDVDVIVGGDSHTLLGDFEKFGLNPAGSYPTVVSNPEGKKVCIVHAWQYSSIVGELDVSFDVSGDVVNCSGTPHLLLGDDFKHYDDAGKLVNVSEPASKTLLKAIDSVANISIVPASVDATRVLSKYQEQVKVLEQKVIGTASQLLCLERVPGQGISSHCDVDQTRSHGSDISQLVALAYLQASRESDIAIVNGGAVRTDIPVGSISIGDVYTLLPFDNTLVNLKVTGAELKQVLEEVMDYIISGSPAGGAYPYGSGIRWVTDLSQPAGKRITAIEVRLKKDDHWHPLELQKTYVVVTNDFIASGKDGYHTFAKVSADGRAVDTYIDNARAFVDFVKKRTAEDHSLIKLPLSEYSTQRFYNRKGELQ